METFLIPRLVLPHRRSWLIGAVILLALSTFTVGFAQMISPKDRYGSIKHWRLHFRFSASSPYKWDDGGVTRDRTRWQASEEGTVLITMSLDGSDQLSGTGTGNADAAIDRYFVEHTQYYSESHYSRGGGSATTKADLSFDFKTGTYQLALTTGDISAASGGRRMQVGDGTRTWGPSEEMTHTPMPTALAPWGVQKLPESGQSIHGSCSWEKQLAFMAGRGNGFDLNEWSKREPTSGTLSWTLEPDDPSDEQLIVEVDNYDKWLPEAAADESSIGNTVTLRATVVSKSGGAPEHQAVRFRWEFSDVSREPGIALNLPLTGGKTTPDLIFTATAKTPGAIVINDGLGLEQVGAPTISATAAVAARDWGAYGTVAVLATLDNGRVLRGHFKGSESYDVRLPKRSSLSCIGDAWKQAKTFSGGDLDDLDEQEGNTHEGDGLTAYEEYRGMIVDGKHTRLSDALDPMKKDLVVAHDLGAMGHSGVALFEQASGIHVIELLPDALPTTRLVNVNRLTASGGEQYGLNMHKGPVEKDASGENRPAALHGKTPKKSLEVVINVDGSTKAFALQSAPYKAGGIPMPYTLEEDLSNTIAHEVAHGVGAPHHGQETEFFDKRVVTVEMRDWRVVGEDGFYLVPTVETPVAINGMIGRPGNEASGNVNCIMTYTHLYQWTAIGRLGGPYRYFAVPLQPVGKIFCRSPDATGYNLQHSVGDKGAVVPGFFGNAETQGEKAPPGNCLGAMHVRDW